jgi:hypothetical protein
MYRALSRGIQEGPTFIYLKNKKLGVDDGEYQIPGEALAVAYHNYVTLGMKFAQQSLQCEL